MQVDPIKPMLKPPGTKRLKLECDGLLSSFAFKFNLRCYSAVLTEESRKLTAYHEAGAYTRPLFGST